MITASEEQGSIKIAAIDNGLAFPFKHPDEWRTCETTPTGHTHHCLICRSILLGVAADGEGSVLRGHPVSCTAQTAGPRVRTVSCGRPQETVQSKYTSEC